MQSLVLQLFELLGFSLAPPTTFAEALPWLLVVCTGLGLVLFLMRMIKSFCVAVAGRRIF